MARTIGQKRIKEILRLLFGFDNEDGGVNEIFEAVIKTGFCPCQIKELGASGECPSLQYDEEEIKFRNQYGINSSITVKQTCQVCWTRALYIPELDDQNIY